ncbi:hypothetical protein [Pleurocapsa sp. PCC 7319]|uniref:hypothetical protein n=1 Tax=Pleurocapsa sp. PCC 7319 TaxID=118161 RepID=UPI00034D9450|nr:hypothetical protein [Pleurocapsa sp. PCC 7319]
MIEPPSNEKDLAKGLMPPNFPADYVEGAVKPHFVNNIAVGEPLMLPMIDLAYSKEAAVNPHVWGMLYDSWTPSLEEDGATVFIQGYENRGENNARKKIYYSAMTRDLCDKYYADKLQRFFDTLLAPEAEGKPLMSRYLENYPDMYWDLHVAATGEDVPDEVRQFGYSFNTVLGYWYPTSDIVCENYMKVRELRAPLKEWLDERVQDIMDEKVEGFEGTFVHYWVKNGELGENFRRKDIVFECFHNFLALSQWGNLFYQVLLRLSKDRGDQAIRESFDKMMSGEDPDAKDGGAFSPLDRFAMELMRVIAPNGGSYSTLQSQQRLLTSGYNAISHPHPQVNRDEKHWSDPDAFNPDRYKQAATSHENDESKLAGLGLNKCPFHAAPMKVKDGRDTELTESVFGTVYGITDGTPAPVCDTAGYGSFGFGYRRCPGELLTIDAVKLLLKTVHREGLVFEENPSSDRQKIPAAPRVVLDDDLVFHRG